MADTLEPIGTDTTDQAAAAGTPPSDAAPADEMAATLPSSRPATSVPSAAISFGLSKQRADASLQAREQKLNTRRQRAAAQQERIQARIRQAAQAAPVPTIDSNIDDDQAPTLQATDTAETIQASRQVAYTEPDESAATIAGNRTTSTQPPAAPVSAVPSAPNRIGRFQLTRKLAQGGMGAVFEATDPLLTRRVAIKRVRIDRADSLTLARFQREIRLSAELTHPGICTVYEGGQDDKGPYFVMRFLDGKPLNKWVREDGPSLEQRLVLFEKVCQALSHAHRAGWLHRDIKPDNIVVTADGTAQVVDWGIARPIGAPADTSDQLGNSIIDIEDAQQQVDNSALTTQGAVIGTPAYMSPEQANGEVQGLTDKSDVYALGAVLYYLVAEKPPILAAGKTALQIVMEARQAKMEPLPDSVPAPLRAVIQKAMHRSPRRRYRSADELRRDVVAFRTGEPGLAWTDGFFTRMGRNWSRHAAGYSLLLTAILVVVLVGAVAVAVLAGLDHARVLREQEQQRSEQAEKDAKVAVIAEREAQKRKADAVVRRVNLEPQIEKVKADMKYTLRDSFSEIRFGEWDTSHSLRYELADNSEVGRLAMYSQIASLFLADEIGMGVINDMDDRALFIAVAFCDQADSYLPSRLLASRSEQMSSRLFGRLIRPLINNTDVGSTRAADDLAVLMQRTKEMKADSRESLFQQAVLMLGQARQLRDCGVVEESTRTLKTWFDELSSEERQFLVKQGYPHGVIESWSAWLNSTENR